MKTAGIIKGRPRDLAILDYGLFKVHSTDLTIGICGFLIRTDKGEAILIDTGFPQKYATNTDAAVKEDRLFDFGEVLVCGPDNLPSAQLAKLGLNPADVTLQICTHTHIDHVGALDGFPCAPILLSSAERALPRPLYWDDVQPLEWPDQNYLLVDGDAEIGPGVLVLAAPGHTPGQISVMVDLPSGAFLLTSDAISRPAEIDQKFAGSWDEEAAIASADRLMRLASERDAFVIYGHCPKQWLNLKKAPEVYS